MKSMNEHIEDFIKLAVFTFGLAVIIIGIIWIITKIFSFIRFIFNRIFQSKEKMIMEAMEYYKIHGVYCESCGFYVPGGFRCASCDSELHKRIDLNRKKLVRIS
ncbi:hypothetical protein ACFL20_09395 [Spirochaetota bacterium]